MAKVLSPKGVEIVEDLLSAMENFNTEINRWSSGSLAPDGKAIEIVQLVNECSGRISDVMEA